MFYKQHTGVAAVDYEAAVEEALCVGWVDSLVRRLDDDRFVRKFSPRKPGSAWSTSNRRRYAKVRAAGLLAPAGEAHKPGRRSGDAPRPPPETAREVEAMLRVNRKAWERFGRLAPSQRRAYVGWIASARREDARQRRVREAIRLLAAGRTLGVK